MTLDEKVGQLFVANVYGETADTTDPADVAANHAMYGPAIGNAEQLIARYMLGGIVYFRWTNNVNEPAQIARLSNGIQRAALSQPARIPMLIATDQEQGVVSRVCEAARDRVPLGLEHVERSPAAPVRIPAADDPTTTLYPYGFGLGY